LINLFWMGPQAKNPRGKIVFNLPIFFSLFGWRPRIVLILQKTRKEPLWPFRKYWQEIVAVVLLLALIGSNFFWYQPSLIQAATYTWVQTDWSGGASTTATAVHPDNQTGWNYYYEKGEDVEATTSVSLTTAGGYVLETSDVDFQEGTFDKTQISGSGDSASITLSPPSTTTEEFTTTSYIGEASNINFDTVNGIVKLYNYLSPSWTYVTDNWLSVSVGDMGKATPAFADIDNDGDYDLAVGDAYGYVEYFRNDGTPSSPSWTHVTDNWLPVNAGNIAVPAFADIDNDGDYDLAVGNLDGYVHYFRNDGTPSSPSWTHVSSNWLSVNVENCAAPAFADIDNDGDYDLAVGDMDGYVHYFRNDGDASSPSWTHVTDNWLSVNVGFRVVPAFADIDNDGDYDLAVGNFDGYVHYFRNDGDASSPSWTHVTDNWLPMMDPTQFVAPAFADIDNDGDYDLAVGEAHGYVEYFRNDGLVYYCSLGTFTSTNLLEGQSVGPIWSFSYYLSSLPSGTSAKVSFSQDGANWYDSSGNLNGWDTMSAGENTIDLSGLGWEGSNFYYKMEFTSDGSDTPVLEWVKVHTDYPSSGSFLSQVLDIGGENPLYATLEFSATTTASTSVKIQLRADDSTSTLSSLDFVGPDGTTSTFYTTSGQEIWEGHSGKRYIQYKVILETTDTTQIPYFNEIKISYGISSYLISSPYDSSDPANVLAKIEWQGNTPSSTEIKFQVRSSPDGTNWTPWCGPDDADSSTSTCDSSTYFTDPSGGQAMDEMFKDGSDDRYFQYKVYLSTTGSEVPSLTSVTVTYVVNTPPEFSTSSPPTAQQQSTGEVKINYSIRDPDTTQGTVQPNYVTPSFEYSLDGGTSWSAINCSHMGAEDCANKQVDEVNFTDYTASWNAKTQIGQVYTQNAKIRITVDDKEAANNTAQTSTSPFELDTRDPQNPQVVVDASTQYGANDATLSLSVSDDTIEAGIRGSMMISATSSFFGANWQDYATSTTFNLPADPSTIYVKFKDTYGNVSAVASVTTPPTPSGVYCQDISNTDEEVYKLFIGWNVVDLPPQGDFDRYIILKSTSTGPGTFERVAEITDRNQNYWMDSNVEYGTTYYYQLLSKDTLEDVSFRSQMVNGTPGSGGEDTLPPSFVSGPTASDIYTTQVTISWETDELSRAILHYGLSSGNYTMSKSVNTYATSHSVVLTGLNTSTTYYLMVEAIDTSDNSATSSEISFSTLSGPVISDVSVSQVFNEKATIFWLTDISADSYVYYSTSTQGTFLTSGKTESVTQHEITIENLTPGTRYYFYVKSSNALDNNEGQYYSFVTTNDTKPPEISNLSAWTTAYTTVIVWQTDELSDSYIEWGTSSGSYTFSTSTDVDTIYHVIRLTDLTENQTYYYKVRSTDPNGNQTESSEGSFKPVRERDTTPPVISNVSVSDVYTCQAKISWQTDELSNSIVEYSTSSDFSGYLAKTDSQMGKSHSVVLTGLLPNTTYYFRVKSRDVENNEAQKSGFSFTTLDGPVISNVVVSQVFNERATIEWQTDVLASSTVIYSLNPDFSSYFGETDNNQVLNHTITLTGLTPGAVYYFYVKSANARDDNGGDYYFFSTANDTQAPQISNISVLEKQNSALILWETDELSTSKIVYGTSSDSLDSEVSDNVLTRKHHVLTLSGLNENTKYYFKVGSCDANSNCATSTLNSFTTLLMEEPKESDTEGPQISEVKAAVVSDTSVAITWKTDELADSKVVFGTSLDYGSEVSDSAFTLSHSVTLSNLTKKTSYYFKVVSKDTSGNETVDDNSGKGYTFTTTDEPGIVETITQGGGGILIIEKIPKGYKSEKEWCEEMNLYWYDEGCHRIAREERTGLTSKEEESLSLIESGTEEFLERVLEKIKKNPHLQKVKEGDLLSAVSEMAEKVITAPQLTGKDYPKVIKGTDSAKIVWMTDKKANSLVAIAEDEKYSPEKEEPYQMIVGNPDELVTYHQVLIENLKPSTLYHFQVRSKPLIGPVAKSEDRVFTTLGLSLEISDISTKRKGPKEIEIFFRTNLPAKTKLKYKNLRTNEGKEISDNSFVGEHRISLADLLTNTEYSFLINVEDEKGQKATSPEIRFSTGKDTQPPQILEVKTSSAISPRGQAIQTIISWQTDELSTSRVYYVEGIKWEDKLAKSTPMDNTLSIRHIVVLPKLKPGKVYLFKTESIDSSQNRSLSKTYTLFTPQRRKTIIQIMMSQFEKTFGWIKNVGI